MPITKSDLKEIRHDADKITKAALAAFKRTGRQNGNEQNRFVLLLVAHRLLVEIIETPEFRVDARGSMASKHQ